MSYGAIVIVPRANTNLPTMMLAERLAAALSGHVLRADLRAGVR